MLSTCFFILDNGFFGVYNRRVMIKLLIKIFIKNYDNTEDKTVREKYGTLSGILGILCNVVLFAVKFAIGTILGSIAVISDSFNNLADSGSSVMTVISAKLSNKKPDKDHPFGHGRFEYVSSLIIAMLIILVGFELGKDSIGKITDPSPINFDLVGIIILCLSLTVKLWMFSYNRYMWKKISSPMLAATSRDSINDVISTTAVIISTVICQFTDLPVDGIVGCAVSLYIMYSGFMMAKDTVDLLLGSKPDPETVKKIISYVTEPEEIVGYHDLIVHDYGPGRVMATVHAEVSDRSDILKIHEIIDDTEQKMYYELGILVVIHMDPIAIDDELTNELKTLTLKTVTDIDEEFSIHDFRIVKGENRINVIFDLSVPGTFDDSNTEKLKKEVAEKLRDRDKRLNTVVTVERTFC